MNTSLIIVIMITVVISTLICDNDNSNHYNINKVRGRRLGALPGRPVGLPSLLIY